MNLMIEHAKELLGMPPEWDGYEFEAIGRTVNQETKLLRVKGAIAPPITKGERKGRPNWRKLDKSTEREAFFTPAEHDEWCRKWEQKTGLCAECTGKGEVFSSWKAGEGTTFKPCKVCGGTGKTPNAKLTGGGETTAEAKRDD